ncbi:MAG: metallophosphoesterase [Acutalibacteraceae bacterium]
MTAQKKKLIIILSIVALLLTAITVWTVWGNTAPELNKYTVSSDRLPEAFDKFRIAHVSDLHNTEIGKNNEKLLNILKEAKPDIIAITGDLIDSRNTDIEKALQFAKEAVKIAPCYYVTGNHEARISEYDSLKNGLTELGVNVLENERIDLERSGEKLTVIGINDPSFQTDYLFGNSEAIANKSISQLMNENDSFTLLLSHRPELFKIYADNKVDLVLSGHAHGGQFRLPFAGGLIAPNQGLFPKYDAGLYTEENTNMIVSRGIGNSIIPLRFNNRPEVVLIELT